MSGGRHIGRGRVRRVQVRQTRVTRCGHGEHVQGAQVRHQGRHHHHLRRRGQSRHGQVHLRVQGPGQGVRVRDEVDESGGGSTCHP